jgi:hypothetical protein
MRGSRASATADGGAAPSRLASLDPPHPAGFAGHLPPQGGKGTPVPFDFADADHELYATLRPARQTARATGSP